TMKICAVTRSEKARGINNEEEMEETSVDPPRKVPLREGVRTRKQFSDEKLPPAKLARRDALAETRLGSDSPLKADQRKIVKELRLEYVDVFVDKPQYSGPQNDLDYRIMVPDEGPA